MHSCMMLPKVVFFAVYVSIVSWTLFLAIASFKILTIIITLYESYFIPVAFANSFTLLVRFVSVMISSQKRDVKASE